MLLKKVRLHRVFSAISISVIAGLICGASLPLSAQVTSQPEQQPEQSTLLTRILGKDAEASLQLLFDKPADVSLTPEEVRALPYAANYARMGDSPRSLLVLGENDNVTTIEPDNKQVLGLKQQWFSASNEVVETYNGYVVSLQNLNLSQIKHVWVSRDSYSPERASKDYAVDVRITSPFHTEHKPHYMTKRYSYDIVSLNASTPMQTGAANTANTANTASASLSSQALETTSLLLPDGRTIEAYIQREVLFQNGQLQATNEFYSDSTTGRIVHSKQWLGPELGYFEFTEAQPYNGGAGTLENWGFTRVPNSARFQALTTTDGSDPAQYIEIRVINAANTNTKHTGLFYAGSRLNQMITEFHRKGITAPYYEPLTRLSSGKLQQQLKQQKQALIAKLDKLAQHYMQEDESKLAMQASLLATQLSHWPLAASYLHGVSLANSRLYLAENPVLRSQDAATQKNHIGYYALHFAASPRGPKIVGLTNTNTPFVYVIDAFGVITKVPMHSYNSYAAQREVAEQPGAVVLKSIADSELPNEFAGLNMELAQLLRHWNWSDSASEQSVSVVN